MRYPIGSGYELLLEWYNVTFDIIIISCLGDQTVDIVLSTLLTLQLLLYQQSVHFADIKAIPRSIRQQPEGRQEYINNLIAEITIDNNVEGNIGSFQE